MSVHWNTVKKGRRVRMTPLGRQRLVTNRQPVRKSATVTTGVFVKFDGYNIRIRRDQHRGVDSYHPDFWVPA